MRGMETPKFKATTAASPLEELERLAEQHGLAIASWEDDVRGDPWTFRCIVGKRSGTAFTSASPDEVARFAEGARESRIAQHYDLHVENRQP